MRLVSGLAILSLSPSLQIKLTDDYPAGNPDAHKRPVDERYRLWVLKKSLIGMYSSAAIITAIEFFVPPQLRGSFHSRCCRLAEEAHQSLDILRRRCQQELLPHELQSAQA